MIAFVFVLSALTAEPLPGADAYLAARRAEDATRYSEAYAAYKTVADAGGPLASYAIIRGAYCVSQGGNVADAAAIYQQALSGKPTGAWVRLAKCEYAALLAQQGRRDEAALLYQQALDLKIRPSWLRKYEFQAADILIQDSTTRAHGYAFFRAAMESAKYGRDRLDAARRLSASPELDDRLLAVSGMLRSSAFKEAKTSIEGVYGAFSPQITQNNELLLLEAAVGAIGSDPSRGHAVVADLIRQDPAVPGGPMALGLVARGYTSAKQFDSAWSVCDAMIKAYPKAAETGEAIWRLATALADSDQLDKALETYLLLAQHCPAHTRAGDALLAAGKLNEKHGLNEVAVKTYRQALALPGYNRRAAASLYSSGELHERLGQKENALQDYVDSTRQPVGDFYVHRAADRLSLLDPAKATLIRPLNVAGSQSFVRAVTSGVADEDAVPSILLTDDRVKRLAFFGVNGLPEGEWETLEIVQTLQNDKTSAPMLRLIADAGMAHTAMEVIDALAWGLVDGKPNASRMRVLYPRPYWTCAVEMGREAGVDPYLLLAMARQESTFRPAIESHAGAKGVMQVMPGTAKWMVKASDAITAEQAELLHDPYSSIRMGAHYLGMMLEKFDGNVVLALGAYNAGPGNMSKWTRNMQTADLEAFIEGIPFEETKTYVQRVLGNYAAYHSLYSGDGGS